MRFLTKREVEEIDVQGNGSSRVQRGQKVKKVAKRVAMKKKKRATKAVPKGFRMQCGLCKQTFISSCAYASKALAAVAINHIYSHHSPLKSHWKCSMCGQGMHRKWNTCDHI